MRSEYLNSGCHVTVWMSCPIVYQILVFGLVGYNSTLKQCTLCELIHNVATYYIRYAEVC